eukprot:3674823-Pleurochrysis_carterae.AAC.1
MGTTVCLACVSLMPTMPTMAHSNPLLASAGSIHRIEAQVMSRVGSNSRDCGLPNSPPRRSRL